jgi:predicted AAA+ superfamily ATPase
LAIQWLVDCGLLLKSHRVSKPGIPLAAYQEISAFKLFLHDVGLLGAMAGLDVRTIIEGDEIFTEFKGALTEQYVMQQLRLNSERYIGYWTNERSTSEVDFVIQEEGKVIPVEVKSGENLKSKSFRLFCEKYKPSKAIRTSLTDYKEEQWITNVQLYAIGKGVCRQRRFLYIWFILSCRNVLEVQIYSFTQEGSIIKSVSSLTYKNQNNNSY